MLSDVPDGRSGPKEDPFGRGLLPRVGTPTARWTSRARKAFGRRPRPCGGVQTICHIHDTTSSGRCGRGRGSSSPARKRVTKLDRQGVAAGDCSPITASASRLAEQRPSVGEVALSHLVAVGVSSSPANIGSSFRGRAAAAAPPSRRLYHAWRSSVAMAGDVAAPSRMEQSVDVGSALLQLVQRENPDTDELRARNASQSGGAGSRAGCGCFWAGAAVRCRVQLLLLRWPGVPSVPLAEAPRAHLSKHVDSPAPRLLRLAEQYSDQHGVRVACINSRTAGAKQPSARRATTTGPRPTRHSPAGRSVRSRSWRSGSPSVCWRPAQSGAKQARRGARRRGRVARRPAGSSMATA